MLEWYDDKPDQSSSDLVLPGSTNINAELARNSDGDGISDALDNDDNDKIYDAVDTLPFPFSNDFSDVSLGGMTTGFVSSNNHDRIFYLSDASDNQKGIEIRTDSDVTTLLNVYNGSATIESGKRETTKMFSQLPVVV